MIGNKPDQEARVPCQHRHFVPLLVSNGYSIIECRDCGLRKTFPLSAPAQIETIYRENFYSKINCARFIPAVEILVRFFRFLRAFKLFLFYHPRTVLDVGCGRGLMLYYLKKYFKATYVMGTQFSQPVIDYLREKCGLELKKGRLQDHIDELKKEFDFISFWHVLEHIDDVDDEIELCRRLLKDKGLLLVEVPNSDSFSERLVKSSWLGWDTPNHLTHFTPSSLANLLKRHGFRIIEKRYFSWEYSVFFSVQSFLNKISGKQNMFYNFISLNKVNKKKSLEIFAHLILMVIFAPWALLINMGLYNQARGECLHYIAQKI